MTANFQYIVGMGFGVQVPGFQNAGAGTGMGSGASQASLLGPGAGTGMTKDVYWGWHKTDTGEGITNFQHWCIQVGDIWYENANAGRSSDGKPFEVNDGIPEKALIQQLVDKDRTAPLHRHKIGQTNLTHEEILQLMKAYKSRRDYQLMASLCGGPNKEGSKVGNCQTLVWHLASKMGCLDRRLVNSDYDDALLLPIPQPGSAPRNRCAVLVGSCTGSWVGSSYTSSWCKRCGYWYCPYHATASDKCGPIGAFHVCYTSH